MLRGCYLCRSERSSEPGWRPVTRPIGEADEIELVRSSDAEKDQQVANVENFRNTNANEDQTRLKKLQQVARERKNTFEAPVEAAKVCSLGSMSHALYVVGGECRRNM